MNHPMWTEFLVALATAVVAATPPTLAALKAVNESREIIRKTDHVIELTNSNLTAVKSQLAMANQHIKELQQLVSKLTEGV